MRSGHPAGKKMNRAPCRSDQWPDPLGPDLGRRRIRRAVVGLPHCRLHCLVGRGNRVIGTDVPAGHYPSRWRFPDGHPGSAQRVTILRPGCKARLEANGLAIEGGIAAVSRPLHWRARSAKGGSNGGKRCAHRRGHLGHGHAAAENGWTWRAMPRGRWTVCRV